MGQTLPKPYCPDQPRPHLTLVKTYAVRVGVGVDARIGLEEVDNVRDKLVDLALVRARREAVDVVHAGELPVSPVRQTVLCA